MSPPQRVDRFATDAVLDELVAAVGEVNTNPAQAPAAAWFNLAAKLREVANYCDERFLEANARERAKEPSPPEHVTGCTAPATGKTQEGCPACERIAHE